MMNNPRALLALRSPQSLMRDLRKRSARLEMVVALALVLSIFTLVAALAERQPATWPLITLA
jgi:hypothetical protein